jgi:hypothetical protein
MLRPLRHALLIVGLALIMVAYPVCHAGIGPVADATPLCIGTLALLAIGAGLVIIAGWLKAKTTRLPGSTEPPPTHSAE